jgi:hypothetical protein
MGGYGSGRWGCHTKADTVEDCLTLDLGQLARARAFAPWHGGTVRWLRGEQERAAIGYTVRPAGGGLTLVLSYRWTRCGASGEEVELPIALETTPLHFGGVRWWGRCPLAVNGVGCGRRAGKLYLPPGGRYFGCRLCNNLTYRSAQEHDKRVDALRRNPAALLALMDDPKALGTSQLLLALKALRWGQ